MSGGFVQGAGNKYAIDLYQIQELLQQALDLQYATGGRQFYYSFATFNCVIDGQRSYGTEGPLEMVRGGFLYYYHAFAMAGSVIAMLLSRALAGAFLKPTTANQQALSDQGRK